MIRIECKREKPRLYPVSGGFSHFMGVFESLFLFQWGSMGGLSVDGLDEGGIG
jgi:hypothetical protein